MIVLICGSRGWHDPTPIHEALTALHTALAARGQTLEVLHGAASKGADFLAEREGRRLDLTVHRMPAQWATYGRAAGPIRNQAMLDAYDVDLVLGFRTEGKSNGTDDMIARAAKAGVPYQVITRSSVFDLSKALAVAPQR